MRWKLNLERAEHIKDMETIRGRKNDTIWVWTYFSRDHTPYLLIPSSFSPCK